MKSKQSYPEITELISKRKNITEEAIEKMIKLVRRLNVDEVMYLPEADVLSAALKNLQEANDALRNEISVSKTGRETYLTSLKRKVAELADKKKKTYEKINDAVGDGSDSKVFVQEFEKVSGELSQTEDLLKLSESQAYNPKTEKIKDLSRKVFQAGIELTKARVAHDKAIKQRQEKITALLDIIDAYYAISGNLVAQSNAAHRSIIKSYAYLIDTGGDEVPWDKLEAAANSEIEKALTR